MNEPPRVTLDRLLAEEAARAIPGEVDLWPDVSRQLHARAQPGITTHQVVNDSVGRRTPQSRGWPSTGVWRRPVEFAGNAVSFGLGALAIVIIAMVVGLPGRGDGPTGIGAGTPEPVVSSVSSPEQVANKSTRTVPEHDSGNTVECTFDLDVSPETDDKRVLIPIKARADGTCKNINMLRMAIVDASGAYPEIVGNPLTFFFPADGRERREELTLGWSNWCAGAGSFRFETIFGTERQTLPLPNAPACVDERRPSFMNEIETATATPEATLRQATPVP